MTHFKLKQGPAIEVTEGRFKGQTFRPGKEYKNIPEKLQAWFEPVPVKPEPKPTPDVTKAARRKKRKKKGDDK
ncbi:MAG: hypothetical protein GY696_05995 [Gammaproteobacteria bacterium]|nr:hypothetical protein [Gammaproteobacteria bacterium]